MSTANQTIQQADAAICLPMSVPGMVSGSSVRCASIVSLLRSGGQDKSLGHTDVARMAPRIRAMGRARMPGKDAVVAGVCGKDARQGGQIVPTNASRGPQATDVVGRPAWF